MIRRLYDRIRPPPAQTDWEDYFAPGEELLWSGAPVAGFKGTPGMVFLSIFGLPFLLTGFGLMVAGILAAFGSADRTFGSGIFQFIFGIPFFAWGIGTCFGSWFFVHLASDRVRYAVTNKACYIAKSWWRSEMECYPFLPQGSIRLREGWRGDTVTFTGEAMHNDDGERVATVASFDFSADGRRVYSLLRRLQVD